MLNYVVSKNTIKKPLRCANNIQIVPDLHVDDVHGQQFDAVILPGGKYYSYKARKKRSIRLFLFLKVQKRLHHVKKLVQFFLIIIKQTN